MNHLIYSSLFSQFFQNIAAHNNTAVFLKVDILPALGGWDSFSFGGTVGEARPHRLIGLDLPVQRGAGWLAFDARMASPSMK